MIEEAVVLPPSDPGRRVAGLPLLERTLLVLERGGIKRVQVVGLDAGGTRAGLSVERVASLAAARAKLDGPFLLSLADRVYEPAVVKLAAAADLDGVDACAAGDSGLVAATPAFLATVEAAGSPAAAVARARKVPTGDLFWAEVTSDAAATQARRELFRRLRKPVDGPVARHVNRRVSLSVTRLLLDTSVTPNQMTVFAALIGIAGVALVFAARGWAAFVLGAALVQVQSILDGCDGEIARLKFQASKIGEWLDNATDDALNVVYCAAMGVAAARLLGQPWLLWVGLGGGAGYAVFMAVMYYQLATVHHSGSPFVMRWWFQPADKDLHQTVAASGAAELLRSLGRRDVMLLAFVGLIALHLGALALVWYAAIGLSNLAVAVAHVALGGVAAARRVEQQKTAPAPASAARSAS